MNQMITQMVDILFQDVVENEETRALHDELMNNCQEHFQDLLTSGLSEDEAVSAVMESLSGMQEVVDQYPRKQPDAPAEEPEEKPAETAEPREAAPKASEKADLRFPADGLQKISISAGPFDVKVSACEGSEVLLCCGRLERIAAEQQDGVLSIRVTRAPDPAPEDTKAAEPEEPDRPLMDMSINELLKKVKSFVDTAFKSVSNVVNEQLFDSGDTLYIKVPKALLPVLEINTSSGDIAVADTHAPDFALRTASGDIDLSCSNKETVNKIFASSASGDIRVASAWAREAEISTISGDVNIDGDFGTLSCKSVSGDVDFDGTAVSLNSKSVSGDVELSLVQAASGAVSAEATSGDVRINLPEDCAGVHVSTSTTIGDVWCDIEDAGSEAPLQIKVRTVSGDIQIRKV